MTRLSGVLAPVPTPFDADDQIDLNKLRRAFARWLATPLAGIVVLGTTGEAPLLDEWESDMVIGAARELVPRDRRFIAGTGRESTRATIAATRRAAELGADAVLVRTPGFFKTQMASPVFVTHYTAVADASPVPVILYNFTAVTGVNLMPDAVAKLSEHPNIVGAKESGSDMNQIAAMVRAAAPGFGVLAGSGTTFLDARRAGACGGILAVSCLAANLCVAIDRHAGLEQFDAARRAHEALVPLARLVGTQYGVPGLKAALNLFGIDAGGPRPPLVPVDAAARAAIADVLNRSEYHEHGSPA